MHGENAHRPLSMRRNGSVPRNILRYARIFLSISTQYRALAFAHAFRTAPLTAGKGCCSAGRKKRLPVQSRENRGRCLILTTFCVSMTSLAKERCAFLTMKGILPLGQRLRIRSSARLPAGAACSLPAHRRQKGKRRRSKAACCPGRIIGRSTSKSFRALA